MPVTTVFHGQPSSPTWRKALVLVHGAGHFSQQDCDDAKTAIESRVQHPINLMGALYTDVPNSPLSQSGKDFQNDFLNEFVRDGLLRAMASIPPSALVGGVTAVALPGAGSLIALLMQHLGSPGSPQFQAAVATLQRFLPGIPVQPWLNVLTAPPPPNGLDVSCTVREVALYLFDLDFRSAVQALVKPILDNAASHNDEVILVSHSLGSVVAFDILRQFADSYPNISYWFTLGCPLAKIARVQAAFAQLGKINDKTVPVWQNVYDTTDLVANALGPSLYQPDCPIYDIFVNVGNDPVASHDYLHNAQTFDIIAQTML